MQGTSNVAQRRVLGGTDRVRCAVMTPFGSDFPDLRITFFEGEKLEKYGDIGVSGS